MSNEYQSYLIKLGCKDMDQKIISAKLTSDCTFYSEAPITTVSFAEVPVSMLFMSSVPVTGKVTLLPLALTAIGSPAQSKQTIFQLSDGTYDVYNQLIDESCSDGINRILEEGLSREEINSRCPELFKRY